MAVVGPKKYTMSQLKAKILQPSLTSHYQVQFPVPAKVMGYLGQRGVNVSAFNLEDYVTVPCTEAALPGSRLATHELNDDYTGVTLRHAYRRLYDETASFTFYVDAQKYYVIRLFEGWMGYITLEGVTTAGNFINRDRFKDNYSHRVAFPNDYKTSDLSIIKFERDYQEGIGGLTGSGSLTYSFTDAYPINVAAMPVSYDSSQLLKCTVDFNFSRYLIDTANPPPVAPPTPPAPQPPQAPTPAPTNTNPQTFTPNGSFVVTNEYYNNGISGTNNNQQQSSGQNAQNATNFADFTDGSVSGPYGQAVG